MPDINKAVKFMEEIAEDDSHGYSQVHREGSPDYDCSSLVGTALHNAGFNVNSMSTTRTLYDQLIACGFVEIGINDARQRGDIFLSPGHHVVMCKDNNYILHASIDENGTTLGVTPGDQTGKEICKRSFYYPSYGWTYHLRYQDTAQYSFGVDLSRYNDVVSYGSVKQDGIDFALIKAITKNREREPMFDKHYYSCINAGIKVMGVYNYLYSTTVEEAKKDAEAVLKIVNERDIIIFLDVEDECLKGLGEGLIDIINAYKNVIEGAKYRFGIYTGDSFMSSYIKPFWGKLDRNNVYWWIARYGINDGTLNWSYAPKNGGYNIFQYTSKGKVNGINGLVDKNVLVSSTTQSGFTAIPTKEEPILVMGQTTANLNIRTKPSTDSDIIMMLNKGDYVQLVASLDGWYKLQTGGYVSKDYINYVHGKVTANKLYLRSTPDKTIEDNKIDILMGDEVVIICTAQGEWYHVLTSTNKTGWASGNYIELIK